MGWKQRSAIAVASAAVLTSAGGVVVATSAAANGASAETVKVATSTRDRDQRAALEKSVDDLLTQIASLEAVVAAAPVDVPSPVADPTAPPPSTTSSASGGTASAAPAPSTTDREGGGDDD